MIQVQINPRATTHAYISHYQGLNNNSLRYFYIFELLTSVELRRERIPILWSLCTDRKLIFI